MKFTKEWLIAAALRAVRTMAQVALTYVTVGKTISDIDWATLGSMVLVSGVYSLLTSIVTTLPEATTDGTLVVDGPILGVDIDPEKCLKASTVRLKVETK